MNKDKKYDVVALGEILIDFTDSGSSAQGNPLFEANPGGAPANVLAMLAKLGRTTAFVGKVGDDMFGAQLQAALAAALIDTTNLVKDAAVNTTLAFVQNAPDGDREFAFFRHGSADTKLTADEVRADIIGACQIFHFGTLSLTHEPSAGATRYAVGLAQRAGAVLSFDPNLRPRLWGSLDEAKRQIRWGCAQCDIMKIAADELEFLSDGADTESGAHRLLAEFPNVKMLFVTQGERGSQCFFGDTGVSCPAYSGERARDTTGAGDTFWGCCLDYVLRHGLETPTERALLNALCFANAAAYIVTTRCGAMSAMPERSEIEKIGI
jgi:fructokinase